MLNWVTCGVIINHESWFAALPHGEACQALAGFPRARARVSHYLLDTLELKDRFFPDFSEPRSRLALLDPDLLANLFLYIGTALRHEEFRNELDGRRVKTLRAELGQTLYEYVTRRVPLSGPVPAYPFEPDNGDDLRQRLIQIGAVCLTSASMGQIEGYS